MSLHGYSNGEYDAGDENNVTLISKLDVSHPLHLHPNDSVALTVVSVKLKGTENYQVWSCVMLLALEGKNKTGFIDGRFFLMSEVHMPLFPVRNPIGLLLVEFLSLLRDLRHLHFLSICLIRKSHRIASGRVSKPSQRSQASAFSVNMPNKGNFQRPQVTDSSQRPSNNNGVRRTTGGSNLDGQNFKGKNVSNNAVGSSSSSYSTTTTTSSNNSGFSDEQLSTLISLIKENSVKGKGVQANMAGTILNTIHLFNKNFEKFFCSNNLTHTKLETKGVITDSGANQHITFTAKFLTNVIDISHLKIKVTHPNGTKAFITKIGNMPLTDYLTLFDVLVVPEYCVSLTFVHKVARDSKLIIAFDELKCYILNQDLKAGKVLGTGRHVDGLYYFDGNQGIELKSSYSNNVCFLSKYTWHCRLGHPANQALNVLRPNLLFEDDKSDVICEICQKAKQTREPFPLSDHVSTKIGELVHLDLWDPYKVTSRDGFRYFLTIVDDFSRAVWGWILLNMWTECILTATYLINILPSSVLSGKSPFELIYKKLPSLKHLRSFGCLAFATILNNGDKFCSILDIITQSRDDGLANL
ncbi:ribonuclease H-like domain-containing protein [Tanacetum coccineum]